MRAAYVNGVVRAVINEGYLVLQLIRALGIVPSALAELTEEVSRRDFFIFLFIFSHNKYIDRNLIRPVTPSVSFIFADIILCEMHRVPELEAYVLFYLIFHFIMRCILAA